MKEINILKKYISESNEFGIAISYFLSLVAQREFMNKLKHTEIEDLNKHTDLSAIMSAIEDIVSKYINKKVTIIDCRFFNIAGEHFYHGFCMFSEYSTPMLILYFSDIQMGVGMLSDSEGKAEFFRLSIITKGEMENLH